MLNDYRLQLPQAVAHDLSAGNIWDFNDLVKYKQENNLSFSMTSVMESIKLEAVATGTFMKAPNGKATNLTERQWLLVRTAAFKRWFGEWERKAELTIKSGQMSYKEADEKLAQENELIRNDDTGIEVPINTIRHSEIK